MTYTITLQNAKNGWVIRKRENIDFDAALALKSKWFHEFHTPLTDEELAFGSDRIILPVRVTISSAQ